MREYGFCKSVGSAFEGSNPPLPKKRHILQYAAFFYAQAGKETVEVFMYSLLIHLPGNKQTERPQQAVKKGLRP